MFLKRLKARGTVIASLLILTIALFLVAVSAVTLTWRGMFELRLGIESYWQTLGFLGPPFTCLAAAQGWIGRLYAWSGNRLRSYPEHVDNLVQQTKRCSHAARLSAYRLLDELPDNAIYRDDVVVAALTGMGNRGTPEAFAAASIIMNSRSLASRAARDRVRAIAEECHLSTDTTRELEQYLRRGMSYEAFSRFRLRKNLQKREEEKFLKDVSQWLENWEGGDEEQFFSFFSNYATEHHLGTIASDEYFQNEVGARCSKTTEQEEK